MLQELILEYRSVFKLPLSIPDGVIKVRIIFFVSLLLITGTLIGYNVISLFLKPEPQHYKLQKEILVPQKIEPVDQVVIDSTTNDTIAVIKAKNK